MDLMDQARELARADKDRRIEIALKMLVTRFPVAAQMTVEGQTAIVNAMEDFAQAVSVSSVPELADKGMREALVKMRQDISAELRNGHALSSTFAAIDRITLGVLKSADVALQSVSVVEPLVVEPPLSPQVKAECQAAMRNLGELLVAQSTPPTEPASNPCRLEEERRRDEAEITRLMVTPEMIEAACQARDMRQIDCHWTDGVSEGQVAIERMLAEKMLDAAIRSLSGKGEDHG